MASFSQYLDFLEEQHDNGYKIRNFETLLQFIKGGNGACLGLDSTLNNERDEHDNVWMTAKLESIIHFIISICQEID